MSEIHGAVGSYVVNALDDDELSEFEAHLAVCETCQREVVEFSETAAHLGQLVEAAPPPALRNSVMSAIKNVRPLPPEVPAQHEDGVRPSTVIASAAAADQRAGEPVLDQLAVRRQRRAARLLSFALAAALVVALGLGGWVVSLDRQRDAQVAESNRETQLLAAPDAKVYTQTMKNGVPVTFVVSKTSDQALLIGKNLPDPGPGKAYQLWTLKDRGTVAVPNNTFDGGSTRKAWFGSGVQAADGVAVTIEPEGGSLKPSKLPPLVAVSL